MKITSFLPLFHHHALYILHFKFYIVVIELQRKLIGDSVRNDALERALRALVKPGMHVLDLGSGTGFLAFLASRLGAKTVTCVEVGDIIEVSKKLAKRNGIRNCTFIRKHSTDIHSLPPVDLLVSETLGNYALEENIIEAVEDAKRFLKPGAKIIPGSIRQFVCPITSPRIPKEVDVWDVGFDLTFDEARAIAQNNIYVKTLKKEDLLAGKDSIRQWDEIDFSKKNASVRRGTEIWKMDHSCTVHGFGLWWDAELAPGISLSTSPLSPPTHWEQIYLPLLEPLSLSAGDTLELSLHSDTRWQVKINLLWEVQHRRKDKLLSHQKLDMRKGFIS